MSRARHRLRRVWISAPAIRSPRTGRNAAKGPRTTRTAAFAAEDADVDALNANHAVLRACWSAVFRSKDAGKRVPALVLGLATHDKTHVDWSCVPPGIATLGLGPVRKERLRGGKVLFGARAGLDFTGAPDSAYGYASRGELSAALDDAGETLAPGEFAADSFGPDHLGSTRTVAGTVRWRTTRNTEKTTPSSSGRRKPAGRVLKCSTPTGPGPSRTPS